jgi:hypothetical protein
MAREMRKGAETASTWASKRGKGNMALANVVPEPAEMVVLAYVSWVIKPGVPEDEKEKAQLRADLDKMGCGGLMEFNWGHEDKHWLEEIANRCSHFGLFPNTIRANLELWKEDLIAEVFKIPKEGKGIPTKVIPKKPMPSVNFWSRPIH